MITRHIARCADGSALKAPRYPPPEASAGALADAGNREPVVGVWPGIRLRWIAASLTDPLGKLSQLVPAPLPDGRERHRVPGEAQRDLVRPARAVMAAHRLDGQHRAIDAT